MIKANDITSPAAWEREREAYVSVDRGEWEDGNTTIDNRRLSLQRSEEQINTDDYVQFCPTTSDSLANSKTGLIFFFFGA